MHYTSLVLAAAALLAAPRQDDLLDRASAQYASTKSSTGAFEQTLTNPLTGTTMTSRGEFYQAMPNRFAVRFTDPKGDRIVNDGKSIWVYVPSTSPGQVIKVPAGSNSANTMDPTQLLTQGVRNRFTVAENGTATIGTSATKAYTLTPKSADAPFTKAKVWINTSDATLRQFEVTDATGLVRRVLITKVSLNAPVKSSEFSFKAPKNVKVFDQSALMGGR
jgi:outer membrane lipoprotein carrier protein